MMVGAIWGAATTMGAGGTAGGFVSVSSPSTISIGASAVPSPVTTGVVPLVLGFGSSAAVAVVVVVAVVLVLVV